MSDAAAAILELLGGCADGSTICPSEAARALDATLWRDLMPVLHEAARGLVASGDVVLTQGGAVKNPDGIVGAYRIRKA